MYLHPRLVKVFLCRDHYTHRLFNVLFWLWNIYEGAELPSVYFITNTKHYITYLNLTQLFLVLLTRRLRIVKYTYYVVCCCILFCQGCVQIYKQHFSSALQNNFSLLYSLLKAKTETVYKCKSVSAI